MAELGGNSGSQVARFGDVVRKHSSYLNACDSASFERRKRFLMTLSERFSNMPSISFPEGRVLEMEFVEGREGLDFVAPTRLGEVLAGLHGLSFPNAPVLETGVQWILEFAQRNLHDVGQSLPPSIAEELAELPADSIVHGEPSNVIAGPGGEPVLIDWDQCGLGSAYQDLGHVCRHTLGASSEYFESFLAGYGDLGIDTRRVRLMAGVSLLGAAHWGDFEARVSTGLALLSGRDRPGAPRRSP